MSWLVWWMHLNHFLQMYTTLNQNIVFGVEDQTLGPVCSLTGNCIHKTESEQRSYFEVAIFRKPVGCLLNPEASRTIGIELGCEIWQELHIKIVSCNIWSFIVLKWLFAICTYKTFKKSYINFSISIKLS